MEYTSRAILLADVVCSHISRSEYRKAYEQVNGFEKLDKESDWPAIHSGEEAEMARRLRYELYKMANREEDYVEPLRQGLEAIIGRLGYGAELQAAREERGGYNSHRQNPYPYKDGYAGQGWALSSPV